MYNAGERKDVRRAEKQAKVTAQLHADAIRGVMSHSVGRAWMYDFLEQCHIFHTAFTGDNNATNFALGEQSMGLRLLASLMQVCPDDYLLMTREANERHLAADSRANTDHRADGGADDPGFGTDNSGRAETED